MDRSQDWCVTLLSTAREKEMHAVVEQARKIIVAHGGSVPTLSEMQPLAGGTVAKVVRLQFRTDSSHLRRLRDSLKTIETEDSEGILHAAELHWSDYKLAVFDLDSTLIVCEGIVEIAAMMGVRNEVAQITESAMRGEIDFQQSFRKRISLLRGLEETRVRELAESVKLTPGAELLLRTFTGLGYGLAIATGGFDFIAARLQRELGIHDFCANMLEFADGRVTGEITNRIIDGEGKAEFLRLVANKHGISTEEILVIGDGANDIPMMQAAGLSIAYHAKPKVREHATCSVSRVGLDGVLYLLQLDQAAATLLKR